MGRTLLLIGLLVLIGLTGTAGAQQSSPRQDLANVMQELSRCHANQANGEALQAAVLAGTYMTRAEAVTWIEQANPGKLVDPQSGVIKDKPVEKGK